MVTKRGRKSSKAVKGLKSRTLTSKEARAVKGGIIAVLRRPNASINWGDGNANKIYQKC